APAASERRGEPVLPAVPGRNDVDVADTRARSLAVESELPGVPRPVRVGIVRDRRVLARGARKLPGGQEHRHESGEHERDRLRHVAQATPGMSTRPQGFERDIRYG